MDNDVRAIRINLPASMSTWLSKLLALVVFLVRTLRGRGQSSQLPPASTYPWDTCSDCRVALPGRVHRLKDASYCQHCHEAHEAALTARSSGQ